MFTNLCCWYILNESIKQEKSILENQDKKTEKNGRRENESVQHPKKFFGKKSAESESVKPQNKISEQEAGTGAQKEIVSERNAESNRLTGIESAQKEAAQKRMTEAGLDERTAYDNKDEKEKYTVIYT